MYSFWQDNDFYDGWKKSKDEKKLPISNGGEKYDFSKLKLIKPFPESEDDILDAWTSDFDFHHRMDALKYCVDNNIPFLRWNGVIYDWYQNQIK